MTDTRKAMESALKALNDLAQSGRNLQTALQVGSPEYEYADWLDMAQNIEDDARNSIESLKAALAAQDVRNTKTNWSELVDWWESGAEQWDGLKEIVSSMIAAQGDKREAVRLPSDAFCEERIKTLMSQAGMPNSRSIYLAFKQFQNDMEHAFLANTHPDPRIKELEDEVERFKASQAEHIASHTEYMHMYNGAYNVQAARIKKLTAELNRAIIAHSEHLKAHAVDMDHASDALEILEAERDAAMVDARRYRYLAESGKEVLYRQYKHKTWFAVVNLMTNYEYAFEESLDVAVDEAMKGDQ